MNNSSSRPRPNLYQVCHFLEQSVFDSFLQERGEGRVLLSIEFIH